MARKASDLFTLLQSRGGGRGASGRSGSGILGQMMGWLQGLAGPKRRRFDGGGGRRALQFSGMALLGIVFASVGAGYLLGDAFPLGGKGSALRGPNRQEQGGVAPQVLGGPAAGVDKYRLSPDKECDTLTKQFYVVANYGEDGRAQASELALLLRSNGVETARPYLFWKPHAWITVVYFEVDQAEAVRQKLLQMPDLAGHPRFAADRKRIKDWPPALAVP
jgi:hypothetical protein